MLRRETTQNGFDVTLLGKRLVLPVSMKSKTKPRDTYAQHDSPGVPALAAGAADSQSIKKRDSARLSCLSSMPCCATHYACMHGCVLLLLVLVVLWQQHDCLYNHAIVALCMVTTGIYINTIPALVMRPMHFLLLVYGALFVLVSSNTDALKTILLNVILVFCVLTLWISLSRVDTNGAHTHRFFFGSYCCLSCVRLVIQQCVLADSNWWHTVFDLWQLSLSLVVYVLIVYIQYAVQYQEGS